MGAGRLSDVRGDLPLGAGRLNSGWVLGSERVKQLAAAAARRAASL